MLNTQPERVGYILKRYPRYSETFIVNEILAHEAAGLQIEIFSLRPTVDSHFQDLIAQVRASVKFFLAYRLGGTAFWEAVEQASEVFPKIWIKLAIAQGEEAQDIYQALLVAREAHLQGITHFHAHFSSSATSVARLASHFSGIPYTFTTHAKDIFHDSVRQDDLERKLKDAKAVVTVSDYNLKYLQETYGTASARVQRLYNGLPLQRFPFQRPQDRSPKIVAVGRLVEKKGFEYLILACQILVQRGCQFHCEIIGTGELAADLQSQIEQLNLQSHVILIGPRPQSELTEKIQQAAVLAAPCLVGRDGNRDGLPTVLLEAMALGTPCVSTDVTGIPEVVRHRQTGLVASQADADSLATALEELLLDPDLRVALANAARNLIEAEFDISQNAAKLRRLFHISAAISPQPDQEMIPV